MHHRTLTAEDAIKRGSDSLLDSKMKDQLTKPRSLTNRAQSLDLTFSLSRISEAPPVRPVTPRLARDVAGWHWHKWDLEPVIRDGAVVPERVRTSCRRSWHSGRWPRASSRIRNPRHEPLRLGP